MLRPASHFLRIGRGTRIDRIHENRDDGGLGQDLAQYFDPLRSERGVIECDARDVAAWSVQARDEAVADRVGAFREHDRNGSGCCLCRDRRGHAAGNEDDRRLAPDQIGCEFGQPVELVVSEAIFDCDRAAFDKASLVQALQDRRQRWRITFARCADEKPDYRHRRLLRTCGERPRRSRTAKRGYELPSSDADGHLTRPQWDQARCNLAKNITPQSVGL